MHRFLACAVLICMSATLLQSQDLVVSPSGSTSSQEPRYVLSVDVRATVIDESGRCVDGLTADDFQLLEDGQEQKISFFSHDSQLPISLGVLIDISGSLQDKLRQGLQTVRGIASTLSTDDEMFVITFNSRVDVKQSFTSNRQDIQNSLRDVRAHGETAVYDAIAAGLREMQTARHRKRILLMVTDGFDTKSRTTADQAQDLLKRSGVLLYAIGIDDDNNDRSIRRPRYHIYDYMLGKLSSAGSGHVIRLYTGRDYDWGLLSEMILGELHQEYTLGYYPTAGAGYDGWRNIEVHVDRPGTQISNPRLFLQRRDANPPH
jgi:Ca-activated chloride channel family protein